MASITIRKLDEQTKSRLRVRAARHNRSMEDEARMILRAALAKEPVRAPNLAAAIRRRFRPFGGVDLRLPARDLSTEPSGPAAAADA
jgi:plasmid stability protein